MRPPTFNKSCFIDLSRDHGLAFPGETFRVLEEKELAKFGEYCIRRMVLEVWDRLVAADVSRL